jgi:hypothetical protein
VLVRPLPRLRARLRRRPLLPLPLVRLRAAGGDGRRRRGRGRRALRGRGQRAPRGGRLLERVERVEVEVVLQRGRARVSEGWSRESRRVARRP